MIEHAKRSSFLIIIGIIFFLSIIVIGIIYLKKGETQTKPQEIKTDYLTKATSTTKDELTTLLKDYYFQNNLITEDNLDYWHITSITYIGYNEKEDTYYYKVEGNYKCLNQDKTCIYVEQELTTEPNYLIYLEVSITKDKYQIKSISQTSNEELLKEEKTLSTNNEFQEKISNIIKEYYQKHNLIDNETLDYWNIKDIQYTKTINNEKVYYIVSNFHCQNDLTTCVYNAQLDEVKKDGSYDNNIYIKLNENQEITSISNLLFENPSLNLPSKEELIKMTKDYFNKNGFVTNNNLSSWDINEVIYTGYYPSNKEEAIINLRGTYLCNDNTSDCIYIEQVGEPLKNNTYPFNIYMVYKDNQFISASGSINSNIISIDQIIK